MFIQIAVLAVEMSAPESGKIVADVRNSIE